MTPDESFMYRCISLAELGAGKVAPNPLVGAVLVHQGRIIGEGYHQQFGQPHAEVNCIASVAAPDRKLIASSTLYVSLEPCNHFGKTPPCTKLILENAIPRVVIGCRDPFIRAEGSGIEKLREQGVEVQTGVLQPAASAVNKRFIHFHTHGTPYIILKWAQTANGKISGKLRKEIRAGLSEETAGERLSISNEFTNRKVHRWRSEEAALLVGTNTALSDNPRLTNRLWTGRSPVRMVIDRNLRLPASLHIFDEAAPTVIFNNIKAAREKNIEFFKMGNYASTLQEILAFCFQRNLQSILVEGGAGLLQSFIQEGCWNEARIISNETFISEGGINAPQLLHFRKSGSERIFSDRIDYFFNSPEGIQPG